MSQSTATTYTLKREIYSFLNKLSRHLPKPDKKFSADITYGTLASGSCLLTDVVNQLHKNSKRSIPLDTNSNSSTAIARGNRDNKMSLKLDNLGQDYIIYLTAKHKLHFHGKCAPATRLNTQRKGKKKHHFISGKTMTPKESTAYCFPYA